MKKELPSANPRNITIEPPSGYQTGAHIVIPIGPTSRYQKDAPITIPTEFTIPDPNSYPSDEHYFNPRNDPYQDLINDPIDDPTCVLSTAPYKATIDEPISTPK